MRQAERRPEGGVRRRGGCAGPRRVRGLRRGVDPSRVGRRHGTGFGLRTRRSSVRDARPRRRRRGSTRAAGVSRKTGAGGSPCRFQKSSVIQREERREEGERLGHVSFPLRGARGEAVGCHPRCRVSRGSGSESPAAASVKIQPANDENPLAQATPLEQLRHTEAQLQPAREVDDRVEAAARRFAPPRAGVLGPDAGSPQLRAKIVSWDKPEGCLRCARQVSRPQKWGGGALRGAFR